MGAREEELKGIERVILEGLLGEVRLKYISEKKMADVVCAELYEQYMNKIMGKIMEVSDTRQRVQLWVDLGVALAQMEPKIDEILTCERISCEKAGLQTEEEKLISQGLTREEIGNTVMVFGVKYKSDNEQLNLQGRGITSLEQIIGLREMKNLKILNLRDNQISDVTILGEMRSLVLLYLSRNKIKNIEPLAGLRGLSVLDLDCNAISDISALRDMTCLYDLKIGYNSVRDISALEKMESLAFLEMQGNQIEDIEVLRGKTQLIYLDLRKNKLKHISVLRELPSLSSLYLEGNTEIVDRTVSSNLKNVRML